MNSIRSPIMIFAGGTGGHVFPALAVAEQIKDQSVPIVWVGTKKGIEARLVPAAGYPIEWLTVNGLRGKNAVTLLIAPFKLAFAGMQVLWLLVKHRPCAVLGMGGFVSGPGGLIAVLLRKPLVIHEQNAIAGLTNRLLAPFAIKILTGFPTTFVRDNAKVVGNPVRNEISKIQREFNIAEPKDRPIRVLVFGGSLGAHIFNFIFPAALALVSKEKRPEVWHQTGISKLEFTQSQYKRHNVKVQIVEFIDAMHEAYAWADVVVCRAGAITVAELAVAGVGAVFIPYPYAVDDHQTANAKALVKSSAALMIQEADLTANSLAALLQDLTDNRAKLKMMAEAMHAFAKPNAAEEVAKVCLQACLGKKGHNVNLAKDFT